MKSSPSQQADRCILRFEREGHRAQLKEQAGAAKRSLNKQLLVLIEAGEKALQQQQQQRAASA